MVCTSSMLQAQVSLGQPDSLDLDYNTPKEYEIKSVEVTGIHYLDKNALKVLSGLTPGDKIRLPGEAIGKAIENLWKQGLLSDIKVAIKNVQGNLISLELQLTERPQLSRYSFKGVTKGEAEKLREKILIVRGQIITDNLLQTTSYKIKEYFISKSYLNCNVTFDVSSDSSEQNKQALVIKVDKGAKTKINKITFTGNKAFSENKLKKLMKETKEKHIYHLFKTSKYIDENFEKDKEKIIAKYLEKGYRDARIISDSVYKFDKNTVNLDINISEGNVYYIRNIEWLGNTKHSSKELALILGISKGDVYNQKQLESGLTQSQSGRDIQSLYNDEGYLFFQITPAEVKIENDSVDLEMRIYEGKQATINRVIVKGNTKTNDRVIMRELRTKPGQLFSRTDIIRTQQEIAALGYFNAEAMRIVPKPNPTDGTVDLEYTVEEKPSDQLELSGGYGGGRLVGTLGVSFNNFSARNMFNKEAWRPLPSGDGQRLSLRAQTSGVAYQSYSASFTEPYLGGRKPNSFTTSIYYSVQNPSGYKRNDPRRSSIAILGTSVGLGKRLKFPDDFFQIYYEVAYQRYFVTNYGSAFLFNNGTANAVSFTTNLSRNSIDAPVVQYPRRGSQVSLSLEATPPFSKFNDRNYTDLPDNEKYKWIEYHKWKFNSSYFTKLTGNLVLNARVNFGFLGYYSKQIGAAPFERFYLGGDGLSNFSLDGREIIALRGYENNSLTPYVGANQVGGTVYNKFTLELRYPVSLNPQAMVYGLAFLEAGNSTIGVSTWSPFDNYKSAGVGVRIFLPMFGLLGLDWGYGFDKVPNQPNANGSNFHFTIGQQFGN